MNVTWKLQTGVSATVNGLVLSPHGQGTVGASLRRRTRYPLPVIGAMVVPPFDLNSPAPLYGGLLDEHLPDSLPALPHLDQFQARLGLCRCGSSFPPVPVGIKCG